MTPEALRAASKEQLALVLGFFPRVDAKLSVLFAINAGMLAVLGTNAPPLKDLSLAMLLIGGLAVLLIAASIVFLYRGAFPRLKGGGASLVYFREIAQRTEQEFVEEFKLQDEEAYINDLLGQAWRNSEILADKFDALKVAFTLVAVAILPWLLSLLLFAAHNSQARSLLLR